MLDGRAAGPLVLQGVEGAEEGFHSVFRNAAAMPRAKSDRKSHIMKALLPLESATGPESLWTIARSKAARIAKYSVAGLA